MVEILRAAVGQNDTAVVQEIGLRSVVEDRWRAAAKTAGSSELERIRRVDPEPVEKEPGCWAPRCAGLLSACLMAAGRWWWGTARPTRQPCSD
jgi:hypothetical protein